MGRKRTGRAAPTRRAFLGTAATLPAWIHLACTPRPRGPSLLVLVADDTSRVNFGAYGNRSSTTPHVDRLAKQGLRFERAYTPVGVCMPARASLFTGLYPSVHGALGFEPIRAHVATLPELLRSSGIATGLIGKLHVQPEDKLPFEFLATGDAFLEQRDPQAFVQAMADFLEQAGERPFALFACFKDPHRPFAHLKAPDPGVRAALELYPFLWDTPETRRDLAYYYAALERMDTALGRMLDLLESLGRAEETLVAFTSDNGMPFPFAKATLYEAGINLPFIVRWPGRIAPGGKSDALVGLIDLLPTALELFGLPLPELHGHSLLPFFSGGPAALQSVLRTDWFSMHTSQTVGEDCPSRALRSGNLKYIRNLDPAAGFEMNAFNGEAWQSWLARLERGAEPALAAHVERLLHRPVEELYDLERDPFEMTDLARDPAQAEQLARLRELLAQRMTEFGDRAGLEASEAAGQQR